MPIFSTGPDHNFERRILLARLVLLWEAIWRNSLPLLVFCGLVAIAMLLGLFQMLSRPLHVGAIGLTAIGFLWTLRPLLRVAMPGREAALRRLETRSGLEHRPATSYEDTLEAAPADTTGLALWRTHKARLRERIAGLKPGWPSPGLPAIDPNGLRVIVLLGLVVALTWAGPDATDRVRDAFKPQASAATGARTWVDAWIAPPGYTGRAPVFLSGANVTVAAQDPDRAVDVPVNSELIVRLTGAEDPAARIVGADAGTQTGESGTVDEPGKSHAFTDDGKNIKSLRLKLLESGRAVIEDGGKELAGWRFSVIPDRVPGIRLDRDVALTGDQAVRFGYTINDDYGVISAAAAFKLAPPVTGEDDTASFALPVAPPDFALVLPKARVKSAAQKVFRDLTAHPWAGLDVELTLTATDEADQTGSSEPVVFTLPERNFRQPLARAFIEQRKHLVLEKDAAPKVARALSGLMLVSDRLKVESSVYLGMSMIHHRLRRMDDMDSRMHAVDLLWELALRVEDGNLSLAERELRAAQEALRRAIAENAPPEEIQRLMDELRQALDKFMQAMAEQMRRNAQNGKQQPQQQLPPNAQMINPQDLAKMMDMIEQLAKNGAMDAAQELLSQLNDILENLQTAQPMPGQQGQQSQMSKMLEELGELMGKQQGLMDETFQSGPDRPGQSNRQGQSGQNLQGNQNSGLAQRQDGIRDMLGQLMQQFGPGNRNAPNALDRAGRAMEDAADALRRNDNPEAVQRQAEAIDQMRQGANQMAREMLQGMGQAENPGQMGQQRGRGEVDPLGRSTRTRGPDFGNSTKVPSEIEVQRAREIMRELQKRLGERFRPDIELKYIERLLDRF